MLLGVSVSLAARISLPAPVFSIVAAPSSVRSLIVVRIVALMSAGTSNVTEFLMLNMTGGSTSDVRWRSVRMVAPSMFTVPVVPAAFPSTRKIELLSTGPGWRLRVPEPDAVLAVR